MKMSFEDELEYIEDLLLIEEEILEAEEKNYGDNNN